MNNTQQEQWTVETLEREMEYPSSVERIVIALNAYEDLLKAAEWMVAWIECEKVPYLIDSDDNPGEALRRALAKEVVARCVLSIANVAERKS